MPQGEEHRKNEDPRRSLPEEEDCARTEKLLTMKTDSYGVDRGWSQKRLQRRMTASLSTHRSGWSTLCRRGEIGMRCCYWCCCGHSVPECKVKVGNTRRTSSVRSETESARTVGDPLLRGFARDWNDCAGGGERRRGGIGDAG